ncbi:MAG TPA: SpoIIE family protein phosphatase [Bacteroidales bacterium]|nr:SpoIIE family protein phosphatase [Bacteroidales bacterium]
MTKKQTTIFNQLILNVIIPTLVALMVMAGINFTNTKALITNSNDEKNRIISSEITEVLEFQELAVSIIERSMSGRMNNLSDAIVNDKLRNTSNIETVDLYSIRRQLEMDPRTEDIYIIDTNGIVVNTTFENDLGFSLFSIGEEHKNHLLHVFDTGTFVNTRFAVEASTKKPRKYTYQATHDRKYIVELGAYSDEADEVLNTIEKIKTDILNDNPGIVDLEIFFMADTIFSLNRQAVVYDDKRELLMDTFIKRDTTSLFERTGRSWYHYQYIFMPRRNSLLYKGSVIRIISDRTSEKMLLRRELSKFLALFAITMVVVSFLIYRKTKVITSPIKKLVENVDRITGGHLSERAEVAGNNEITRLSEKFNMMIDELEKYYNELEQMVRDRTAEIEKQKMEIEAQRDVLRDQKNKLFERNTQLKTAYIEIDDQKRHIMDSIYYARRIQTAILPSDDYITKYFKDHFILYRPKDIVSGDFYWFQKVEDRIMIAAVDCTGHGVPGAFMSIVGYNQLNHSVSVKKARTSDDILNNLNQGVVQTLSENIHESKVMDGMDLALLVFDDKFTRVEYSGANNALILIRNDELLQFRPDKFPIGAYDGYRKQIFTRNDIELKKGDMLYIYSDGYPDQFGGPDDKKFTTKKFKLLLQEINRHPVWEQHEILNTKLEKWMGEGEQIDDVLVIGIKI